MPAPDSTPAPFSVNAKQPSPPSTWLAHSSFRCASVPMATILPAYRLYCTVKRVHSAPFAFAMPGLHRRSVSGASMSVLYSRCRAAMISRICCAHCSSSASGSASSSASTTGRHSTGTVASGADEAMSSADVASSHLPSSTRSQPRTQCTTSSSAHVRTMGKKCAGIPSMVKPTFIPSRQHRSHANTTRFGKSIVPCVCSNAPFSNHGADTAEIF